MRLPRNARNRVPGRARTAIDTAPGERLLAWAEDEAGAAVVASTHRLLVVTPAGEVDLGRPWHLVDAGGWDHDTFALTVTWVDGARTSTWVLPEPRMLPETVRERVQASVVLAERVELPGRRFARVVVRSDLATGDLLEQTILGRGVRRDDPGVAEATAAARADLREQVGLD